MAAFVERAVVGKLNAALAAAGLSAVKVYPNVAPQDAPRPYIAYAVGSQTRGAHGGLVNAQVNAYIFAADFPAVVSIVEAIRRVDRSGNELVAGVDLRLMLVEGVTDNFVPPFEGDEAGIFSQVVSLRVVVIETNYNVE